MAALTEIKAAARDAAYAARKRAKGAGQGAACDHLVAALAAYPGAAVSGYWPIRTEIDPRPALHDLAGRHPIVLPVVDGPGRRLSFRHWTPGAAMIAGAFGAAIPADPAGREPDVLIVPLLAFDARGYRLGYGGGFYDRTLEDLRAARPTTAIGFAFTAQEIAEVPTEPTDQRLDAIVTEAGLRQF